MNIEDADDEVERLRAALELFIQTVNPPYPQSMALWQEHLKAATENARKALTVNEQSTVSKCVAEHMGGERCVGKCLCPKDCCETPL